MTTLCQLPRITAVDTEAAARHWASTWSRAWPARDTDAIAALYSEAASYRALAFREPDLGLTGVRRYLDQNFAVERDIECWFGEPIVAGDAAAVEWWGSWEEQGDQLTLAGVTVLRVRRRREGRRPPRLLERGRATGATVRRLVISTEPLSDR